MLASNTIVKKAINKFNVDNLKIRTRNDELVYEIFGSNEQLKLLSDNLSGYFCANKYSNKVSLNNNLRIHFMKKNTVIKQKDKLDRFYTNPDEIDNLLKDSDVNKLLSSFDTYIEPSCGTGSIVNAIQNNFSSNILMYDVIQDEKYNDDTRFTKVNLSNNGTLGESFEHVENGCVIMNPPFGRMCNTAVKFFNHLASFYGIKIIAQIIPRTFRKSSIQNKLNKYFHLMYDVDYNSHFTYNNEIYDVPCCFQIWIRKDEARIINSYTTSKYIEFTTKDNADVALRRAGGKAGQLLEGLNHTASSTYFIKLLSDDALTKLQNLDLTIVNQTAGVKSISKEEIYKQLGE